MSKLVYDDRLGEQIEVDEGYAWAAVCVTGSPRAFVHGGAVYNTRVEVMQAIGAVWGANDWRKGWLKAKRRGWRAMRVSIEVSFGGGR